MAWTSKNECQTYIYSTLLVPSGTIDATLTSLGIVGIYDWMNVPQNAAFDYITLGDGYEMPKDTLGLGGHSNGFLYYPNIHIWSSQRNTANPDAVENRINQLLINRDTQPWTLPTLTHVYTMLFRTNNTYDSQGTIPVLHKTLQYQIYTTQS